MWRGHERGPAERVWERMGTEMFWNLGCSLSFLGVSQDFMSRCWPDTMLGAVDTGGRLGLSPRGPFALSFLCLVNAAAEGLCHGS